MLKVYENSYLFGGLDHRNLRNIVAVIIKIATISIIECIMFKSVMICNTLREIQ
jgi:hypothetical protein